jgi:hypothetical protein
MLVYPVDMRPNSRVHMPNPDLTGPDGDCESPYDEVHMDHTMSIYLPSKKKGTRFCSDY